MNRSCAGHFWLRTLHRAARRGAALCLVYAILLRADVSAGAEIRYSWSGTIVPTGANDPWLIGANGLPFTLEAKVRRNAPDLADVDLEVGLFAVDQARLVVAGQEIPYVGEGFLDFTDDSFADFDLLTFQGLFERNGVRSVVSSVVTLPVNAVQFVVPSETAPVFGNVANVLRSSTGSIFYGTYVESGTPVLGVPEPRAICISLLAFGILLSRCLEVSKSAN